MEDTVAAFTNFHQFVLGSDTNGITPTILVQLSKSAIEIASISLGARRDGADEDTGTKNSNEKRTQTEQLNAAPDEEEEIVASETEPGHVSTVDRPSPGDLSFSLPRQSGLLAPWNRATERLSAAYSLLGACIEQASGLIGPRVHRTGDVALKIGAPLRSQGPNAFLASALSKLSFSGNQFEDISFILPRAQMIPKMLRTIEGCDTLKLPRSSPPRLQQLKFGRTRTMLLTAIPELQGEWLEASDVEEYLEERGIYIRGGASVPTFLAKRVAMDKTPPWPTQPPSNNTPSAGDSNASMTQPDTLSLFEQGFLKNREESLAKWHAGREAAYLLAQNPDPDWTVFGRPRLSPHTTPSGMYTFVPSPSQQAYAEAGNRLLGLVRPAADAQHDNDSSMGSAAATRITVNMDILMNRLAAAAVCIGEVPGVRAASVDIAIRESMLNFPS